MRPIHKHARGEAEFKKAFALDPDCPTAHAWYAFIIGMMGGGEQEALAEVNRATNSISRDLGPNHIYARRFDESNVVCIRAREIDPSIADAHSRGNECLYCANRPSLNL